MAPRVFSEPFITDQGLNGTGFTIVVPDGHTYVVKQLTVYMDPLLAAVRAFFRDLDSGATLFSAGTTAANPGWFGFYGALVFLERASFRFEVSATLTDGADVYAGGYDLLNS